MRHVNVILAAWVASLGFDLFLHGGLLARLYLAPGPFLLDAMEAFRRIPAGYLGFLVLTASLYWLLYRMGVRGGLAGARTGGMAGAILWGAFLLGLWSISTAPLPLLLSWWLGQSVELGISGGVIGTAAAGSRMRRIWLAVALWVVLLIVATVGLQTAGIAPPMVNAG